MDKLQIAKYGVMQVVSLVYAIMVCGIAGRIFSFSQSDANFLGNLTGYHLYECAVWMSRHGVWFIPVILIWTGLVAYGSSSVYVEGEKSWQLKMAISACLFLVLGSSALAFVLLLSAF